MLPASASCSKKLDHSSASVSLLEGPLSMNSVARFGVLGVRRGVPGTRSLPGIFEVPGRARPACSRCSICEVSEEQAKEARCRGYPPSSQPKRAAMSCRIWNFFGSDRSRARKCNRWFVTICLGNLAMNQGSVFRQLETYRSTLSSGLPFLRKRRAFVKWSLRVTASCRSLPMRRFFSLTSFSKGRTRSNSSCAV